MWECEMVEDRSIVYGVICEEDSRGDEPVVLKLTDEEMQNDALAPVWVVELWQKAAERWYLAADFRKGGKGPLPVTMEKAIEVARWRQNMRADFIYRIRNLKTHDVIMAAILR